PFPGLPPTTTSTLSLPDALPISADPREDVAIAGDRVVDAADFIVEPQRRGPERLTLQLLACGVDVIEIHVGIGEDVDELAGLELGFAGHEVEQERVLRNVERYAEDEIAGPLVHHQRQARARDEKLEEGVASRQRGLLDLAGIPGRDQHSPARRPFPDETDDLAQLIDARAVGRGPVSPLLPVVAAG